MTQLKYSVPSVGQKNTTAEPLVDTALAELKTVVNGELNSENLKAGGIAKEDLSTELKTELGSFVGLPLEAKKSIIATEQERESATFGTLSTPDEVEVTLGTNGLLVVGFEANWESSVASAGRAAIFLGANQLLAVINEAGIHQEARTEGTGTRVLYTEPAGIASPGSASGAQATTGQILGAGVCHIFAAAGTYKVSVRFRATSGKVKAKERKLWAYVIG